MNVKTVMVSLALDGANEASLRVAGDLARRFEARLIGIAAAEVRPPLYFAEGAYAQGVMEGEEVAIRNRLSELEAEFRGAMENHARPVEWRSALAPATPFIASEARAADVIVVGARAEALVDPSVAADPNGLLMQAGRPLITVPRDAQGLALRDVLVAWKDVREARRAVADALPILAAAKTVTVAEVAESATKRADALAHVDDVARWLREHGVVANTIVPDSHGRAVEQLDEIAGRVGAGLVVAGAYGHSRLREWVLGGVTRHLATASARCAFLSR